MFNAYEFGVTSNKYYSLVFYFVDLVLVWIALISAASVFPQFFFFFFFSFQPQWLTRSSVNSALVHCSRTPQTPLFINFFIKNGSHNIIYTFKNYFAIVFLVFSFQFQQNKFYPNRPLDLPART